MKENDNNFINQVVDFYYTTIDASHPQGNMSAVAGNFSITRAKVNKILITAGVIDSPLHQDIMKLKERGYDTEDIASALNVSAATVKINTPYEKVIYNGEIKSIGAEYVEQFRTREKVFLQNVVRKPGRPETEREILLRKSEMKKVYEYLASQGILDSPDMPDDPICLVPDFSEEESKLFKMGVDLMVLHIELDGDLSDVKDLAEIEYKSMLDKNRYTISRDILVPSNLPLHNLHYVINQAFGFTNSHLHEFLLSESDLNWLTDGKVSRWKKLVGLVFKDPFRDEDTDFWDDDYEGGSPKKWMRSKYTGPTYNMLYEESYAYIRKNIKDKKIEAKTLDELRMETQYNVFALSETLPISEILSETGKYGYKNVSEYDKEMEDNIRDAAQFPSDTTAAQPIALPFTDTLEYNYDFGDGWSFIIKAHHDAKYLADEGRISTEQMREAIKDVCTIARPVVVAADGLPLVEDVGGPWGYMDFLQGINGLPSDVYPDKEESLSWAKWNGWSGKIGNIKTLL